ncbi:GerMN domain-containing protein [Agromyces sp. NPDC056523]|uniref:GerMN domain-containing protein n=1 Tax=Agromyces sp. NPDC056523 TaxID=3345850 RepID=UPI00366BE6F4
MRDRVRHPRALRAALAALATALLALTTACVSIPTSGSVNPGLAEAPDQPVDLDVFARGPQPGATQQQILDGFIDAAASPSGNYEIARQFLTEEFSDVWEADTGVTIDVLADRSFTPVSTDVIRAQAVPAASLAPNGQYLESLAGAPLQLEYRFQQVDGEWRISSAPSGVLMDETNFQLVYRDYTLAFFDPQFRFVVPDVRFFAGRDSAQTSIVRALLAGPAEWLAPGVVSAFPEDLTLDPGTVPVSNGVAEVSLAGAAFDNLRTVQLMQYQLEQSLQSVRNVDDVQLSLNGVVQSSPELTDRPERSPRVDPRPVVYDGQAFGHLAATGAEVSPIGGISDQVVGLAPTGAALGPDGTAAAVRAADGVWLVREDAEQELLDPRAGLIVPALDVDGIVWSVPADAPDQLAWFASDGGEGNQIGVPWTASRIVSLQVSRDGTRLVALLAEGSRTRVVAASIQRDEAGRPLGLGPVALELAGTAAAPIDVAWLDPGTVGTLTQSAGGEPRLALQELGAPSDPGEGPAGAVQVDGANSIRDLRVLTSDGDIATRAGVGWQVQSRDVVFLATQQTD